MKNKFLIALLMLLSLTLFQCTSNQRAKKWGGSYTIELKPGQKLVEATWKGDDLWYLTRERREGEYAETFYFKEDSSWGVLEGVVTFKEK